MLESTKIESNILPPFTLYIAGSASFRIFFTIKKGIKKNPNIRTSPAKPDIEIIKEELRLREK
jgi:hypothetical protein